MICRKCLTCQKRDEHRKHQNFCAQFICNAIDLTNLIFSIHSRIRTHSEKFEIYYENMNIVNMVL